MTERTFRIFLGAALLLLLYLSAISGRKDLILYYIGLLVFEGVTNWRFPKLVTLIKNRISYGSDGLNEQLSTKEAEHYYSIPFEAERAMRLVVALILISPLFISASIMWILPWFVASMLLLAGVTNICPMVMLFRWMGFK